MAKPISNDLKLLNGDFEEWRSKLIQHYQSLVLKEELVSAEAVKNAFLGFQKKRSTIHCYSKGTTGRAKEKEKKEAGTPFLR